MCYAPAKRSVDLCITAIARAKSGKIVEAQRLLDTVGRSSRTYKLLVQGKSVSQWRDEAFQEIKKAREVSHGSGSNQQSFDESRSLF